MRIFSALILTGFFLALDGSATVPAGVEKWFKDGMSYSPEGNANLSLGPNNELIVSSLGNTGQDGFSVGIGEAQGWSARFVPFPIADNSVMANRITGIDNVVVAEDRIEFVNGHLLGVANRHYAGSNAGRRTYFEVRDEQRRLLDRRLVNLGEVIDFSAYLPPCGLANPPYHYERVVREDLSWWRVCWPTCSGTPSGIVERTYCFVTTLPDPPPPKVRAVTVLAQGAGTLSMSTTSMRVLGHDHTGLGISTMSASNGMLTIGNIGSSGQDGVAVNFRDLTQWSGQKVRSFDAVLSPIHLAPAEELRATAVGRFNGNDDAPLGWAAVRNVQGVWQVLADFAAVGAGSVRVEAYNGNALAGSATLPSGGVLGVLTGAQGGPPQVPIRCYGAPFMAGGTPGIFITFPEPIRFSPPNQPGVMGDRFHLLALQPSGPVETLQEFRITAANLKSFTIENEIVQAKEPAQLLCPSNIVVECQGSNGTPVNYAPVPTNFAGPNITIVCSPPSGTAFAPGTRTVQCGATDDFGESATCFFTVTVRDTTPPILVCPTNIVVSSLTSTGIVVNYIAPGAADNCDPNVTVTCTPPSGSVLPAGTTTVTCTAVDDANNTGTCSFQVKVNAPPAPVIAHGLAYRPLGQAQLAVDANGELLVSNMGASGQDGFRVEPGAVEGWEGEFVSNPFGPGEQLHSTRVHHAFGGLLSEDRLSFSQQGLVASVDFSPVGVVTSLVEVVGQAFSSAERVANNQWVGLRPFGANSPRLYRRTLRSQRTAWTLAWPSEVTYAFDYSDAEPDFFGLDPNVIEDEEDDLGIALPISAVDFFYQNTPPFRIRRASLRLFGQDHFALGQTVFHTQWRTLSLSNIGPSGLDGVLIPLPQVTVFAAELMPENLANTPAGASFHFEASGSLGARDQPSYRGSLGSIRFAFTGQRLELLADFSVFGVPGAVVEIYDRAALVATFSLGPNQSGFAWPSWPTRIGISPGDTVETSAPMVFEAAVGSRQQFILSNQRAIMGDRVTIRPLGSIDRLSALDQVSLRVASRPLTILHETTDWRSWSAPVPGTYATWSAGQWLPDSPESTKPDADSDGDGISNFVEYGLGLDPRTPGRTGLPQVTFVPDGSNVFGALRLRVPIWSKDVRYRVWATDSLEEPVQWVPLHGHFTEEPVSSLHKEIIIRDLVPNQHQRFLKVDVEQVELAGGLVTEAPILPTTGDSLRIGVYNAQFLSAFDRFECCDDMPDRARRIGERIRATGFDVIALCEVFDSDAKAKLVDELTNTYPHFVRLLRGHLLEGPGIQDSGLMLFSRYPFVGLPATAGLFIPGGLIAFSAGMPWPSVAFTHFEACSGIFRSGSDCLAQKGAGLVRIQNPNSGRIYNVVFTHLDASSGDNPSSEDALTRASQLRQIREMLEAILGSALNSEDVFLLGDLNIKGQLFGDRAEWTRHFGTPGSFFTDELHDAWEEQTNLPELSPVVAGFELRDQGLTSKIHAPGGSRNRKDYFLVNRPSLLPPGRAPLRVQHMAIAFGLRDSLPTPLAPSEDLFEPAAFGWAGRQDLSDHYGIIADLNLEAPLCSPQTSSNNPPLIAGAGPNVATVLRGTLLHAGGMHWYRFDQPGTYSIAVRSGNFTNHVYDSRQLSLPVRNYREESRTLVDSTGAEVTARIFDVPESPLYLRVSHIHRTGRGDYELIVRRHEGSSPDDAIILTPNNNTRPHRVTFVPTRGESPCRWFRFNTERSDSGRSQHLTFFVRPFTAGRFHLSVLDNAVPRSSLCAAPGHILAEREGEVLVETELLDFSGGESLFMAVRPSDRSSTVSFEAGWDTDLTVIHPYVPGYCPGSATATSLTCRDEIRGFAGPGDDRDVRIDIDILDGASGDVLVPRDPLPLLDAWDKGRNHNVEAELGTIRFLPSEEVRVRLIIRSPGDDEKPKAIIRSLARDVYRACNATTDLVRDHGGRYQLNFHMSHGLPAIR